MVVEKFGVKGKIYFGEVLFGIFLNFVVMFCFIFVSVFWEYYECRFYACVLGFVDI